MPKYYCTWRVKSRFCIFCKDYGKSNWFCDCVPSFIAKNWRIKNKRTSRDQTTRISKWRNVIGTTKIDDLQKSWIIKIHWHLVIINESWVNSCEQLTYISRIDETVFIELWNLIIEENLQLKPLSALFLHKLIDLKCN